MIAHGLLISNIFEQILWNFRREDKLVVNFIKSEISNTMKSRLFALLYCICNNFVCNSITSSLKHH